MTLHVTTNITKEYKKYMWIGKIGKFKIWYMKTRHTSVQQIFEQCSSFSSIAIINTVTENSLDRKEFILG